MKTRPISFGSLRRSTRLVIPFLLLVACQSTSQTGTKRYKLAFVTNNASDFWTIARKGMEKAAKENPSIDAEFRINPDNTAAEQHRLVDDLLAKGIDGIAISPVDPVNQLQMLNRAALQALVITQDSDAPNSNRACYIGTDNVEAGRQAGVLVKEALPAGGKDNGFCRSARCRERATALPGFA